MTAPFATTHDSATVSTTEYSIIDKTTTGVPIAHTTAAKLSGFIDVSTMVAGDTYVFRVYEKVNGGTAKLVWEKWVSGAQPGHVTIPELWLNEGYDLTALRTAGADRVIAWSYKLDVGDVSSASITALAAAVFAFVYEGSRTFQDFTRLTASVLWNKMIGGEGSPVTFRDDADSKNRVVANYSTGTRTPTTRDAS